MGLSRIIWDNANSPPLHALGEFVRDILSMVLEKFVIMLPTILMSLTFHEVAHGWVAEKLGDDTARRMGRITLNPLKHLDPLGTLVLVVTQMVGWAKPVPIYPGNFRKPRQMMAIVALAGPMMNIALALISTLLFHGLSPLVDGLADNSPDSTALLLLNPLLLMLHISVIINVALAVFNAIPINPLDGGRILNGFLPQETAEKLSGFEGFGFVIIIALVASGILSHTVFPLIWKILELLNIPV